jgi:hypothetical protein
LAEQLLSDDFLRQLMNVGEVDLVVDLPTHNHAAIVGKVVQAVRVGLLKYFPRERAVLINSDAGSRDGSVQAVLQAAAASLPADAARSSLRTFHAVTASRGEGASTPSGLVPLMAAADLLQAKACAVISPTESVNPDWIQHLLGPLYRREFALVAPLYRRHKFEGLLIKLLLYPMMRAMYGKRIREPYPTDFGFSGRLASELLAGPMAWEPEAEGMGDQLWLTTSAVANGHAVCEAFLGAKAQTDHTSDLVRAMRQTAGGLFASLPGNVERWQTIQGSEPVPLTDGGAETTSEPLRLNRKRLYAMFRSGVTELQPVLSAILAAKTLAELTGFAAADEEHFCFPDALWARVVYEFAVSYHKAVISRDHIIQALVPLYRGKLYEFLTQNRHATAEEVEGRVEALCLVFERLKVYLLQLWNGQEGASYEGNDPPRAEPDVGRSGEGVCASGATADRDAGSGSRGMAHRVCSAGCGAGHPAYQPV